MAAPRGIEALVEQHVRAWELEQRAGAAARRRPCVVLSRLAGVGSGEFGHHRAERLGYAFFGIEIVDRIARETGLQRQIVAGVDERVRNAIERFVTEAFHRERFVENDYIQHVVRTVATLGEQGGAVILGRGSPFILGADRALRVLLVAPRAFRAEQTARRRSLSVEDAAAQIDREDAERREFLRHHFRREPDDAALYDLALNLATLSRDAATTLVEEALRARFPQRELGAPRPRATSAP